MSTHISNVHLKVKNYKCEICGKSFAQSGVLKRHHKAFHEQDKNFKCVKCNFCGKQFSENGQMKTCFNGS